MYRHFSAFIDACSTQWIQRTVVHLRISILDSLFIHHSDKVSRRIFSA